MCNAGLNASERQYLNAHGSSTPLGDKAEILAIKRAFGDPAKNRVVNSTQSMTGHLLGAAGGIEAVVSVMAIHQQTSPPTVNIFQQDADSDLDDCANMARSMRIDMAIFNSFGFGGSNAAVVFRRM